MQRKDGVMNKKKKSGPVGTIVFLVLLAAVIIGVYLKITGDKDEGTQEIPADVQEVDVLLKRDLIFDYPQTPREVLRFYCRITKCLYNEDLSDEQIKKLVQQVRMLYSDKLLENNSEEDQIALIKGDREKYSKDKKTIYSYTIDSANNTEYIETKEGKTALLKLYFTLRAGANMDRAYEIFSLVEDSEKRWKIAAWKAADQQTWD